MKTLSVIFAVCLSGFAFNQNAYDTPELNRAILKYFGGQELQILANENPDLYNDIHYYYTQSFTVSYNGCPSCPINYDEFFNHNMFDVASFEGLRDANTDIVLPFMNNVYTVSLKSKQSLQSEMGSTADEMFKATFPTWPSGGSTMEDYRKYKDRVTRWAMLFSDNYRTITNDPDLLKVKIEEFLNMSSQKQNTVLNHPTGYLLID